MRQISVNAADKRKGAPLRAEQDRRTLASLVEALTVGGAKKSSKCERTREERRRGTKGRGRRRDGR